jgi:hypothetical protein
MNNIQKLNICIKIPLTETSDFIYCNKTFILPYMIQLKFRHQLSDEWNA